MTNKRLFFITGLSSWYLLSNGSGCLAANQENCCQPGRIESAQKLICQEQEFQLKASQFHAGAASTLNDSTKLQGSAEELRSRLKLQGASKDKAAKQLKQAIADFKLHSEQYRSHLQQVEQQLGFCQASAKEYQENLTAYTLHTEQFHLPDIRPPHICKELNLTQAQSSHLANSMRVDQQRVMLSEQTLASAESNLADQIQHSMAADGQLLKRSALTQEERKLSGEFASLKTEYEMLKIQHQALGGFSSDVTIVHPSVHAKLK